MTDDRSTTGSPELPYQAVLLCLGAATSLALIGRSGIRDITTIETVACTLVFASAVFVLKGGRDVWSARLRLLSSYLFIAWYYLAVARIVPALGLSTRDNWLREVDEQLFGVMPALSLRQVSSVWLSELASLCYLLYLVYLHVAMIHALTKPVAFMESFDSRIWGAYAVGLPGYLLIPAIGPKFAFPEIFSGPLPGGILTRWNEAIVAWGSSRFDAFPSLHFLIAASLLAFDWRHCRRRFWIMALPSAGIAFSTLYLGYHYAIDLVTGALWFFAINGAIALGTFRHVDTEAAE